MRGEALLRHVATASVATLVVAVVATSIVVLVPSVRDFLLVTEETPAYVVGEAIDLPADAFRAAPRTLLLFARSTCAACQQAQPFFLDAIGVSSAQPGLAVALVTTGRNKDDELIYGRTLGLVDAQIHFIAASDLRLKRVPSVAIVDQSGVVRFFRETLTGLDVQRDVLDTIRSR